VEQTEALVPAELLAQGPTATRSTSVPWVEQHRPANLNFSVILKIDQNLRVGHAWAQA
jgi:hypothetical protein